MKKSLIVVVSTAILLTAITSGFAEGFVNLDFESANPSGYVPGNNNLPTSAAFPSWTTYYSTASGTNIASTVYYDSVSAGGAAILLEDSNAPTGGGPLPIQGLYSVLLEGGGSIYNPPDEQYSASIGQSGTIPITAQSLTFFANQSGLQVSFNGQSLSFEAISNALNYTVYGANISPFAGQTGQLLFTAPGGHPYATIALLDDIQFSPFSIVPEPSIFGLLALGGLFFGLRASAIKEIRHAGE